MSNTPELNKLKRIGAGMANSLFNLAHNETLPADIRELLKDQQREWDAAMSALQSAADTPAPVFASRHNDETGECEAVEVSPSGYQSIITRTIINRPTVTDEMIERAEADVVPAVDIPIIASLQRHAEDRGVTTEIGQDMVAAIDVIRSLAAAQHQSNLRGEPLAYLVEWYDNGEHMRLQFDRKMEPWVCNCNPTVMPLYASPLPPVTMDTSPLSPSRQRRSR